jgi:haloalkane dehalogenase
VAVKEALAADRRPVLLLWADSDGVLPLETAGRGMERLLIKGAGTLMTVENAGHFLHEDRGEFVGEAIVGWLESL